MPQKALEIRVENLENTVAGLARLPQQMQDLSSQFLQLRQEVKVDISGVRIEVGEVRAEVGELRAELGEVRAEVHELRVDVGGLRTEVGGLREDVTGLRGEMYSIRDELRVDMASMHKDLAKAIVANGVEMRALHEAVIERIKLLGEYGNGDAGSSNTAGGRSWNIVPDARDRVCLALVSVVRNSRTSSGRGIPPRGVAHPSFMPNKLALRAWRFGRRAPEAMSWNSERRTLMALVRF